MFGVYLFSFIIMYIFLLMLTILIHKKNCHIDDFIICLCHFNEGHITKKSNVTQKWVTLSCNYLITIKNFNKRKTKYVIFI
jgi:hypothetical protein